MKRQAQTHPQTTPELQVRLTKRTDGSVVLQCTRRDGSVTWQRYEKQSNFYSFHDLRHFAVESTLGVRHGFYGLIADGWDITDTAGKGPRGKPPSVAFVVEHIVGLLERERAGGATLLPAAEFNGQIRAMVGADANLVLLGDAQLTSMRKLIEELHSKWAGIPAGATFELIFNRD